jgi:glycosyltransferase involved in cell wall biosynthesis
MELLIIGDGPARHRLERRLLLLNPARPVRFAGWMRYTDVARELAQADVLVHPALRECGGSSVLEAMACALPVIAAAWGGPADYVDETCGILIPPITPEQFVRDLAAAIVKLAQSREMREQLGNVAREHVVTHYDWAEKVRRIHGLYEAAVDATEVAAPLRLEIPDPQPQAEAHAPSHKKPSESVASFPAMAGK